MVGLFSYGYERSELTCWKENVDDYPSLKWIGGKVETSWGFSVLESFTIALMIDKEDGVYDVTLNLQEGWNIITGTMPIPVFYQPPLTNPYFLPLWNKLQII